MYSATHLCDRHNRYMEPDCDAYALCGHLIPDRGFCVFDLVDHPPPEAGESFCEDCIHIFLRSHSGDDELPDDVWVRALDNYTAGRDTTVPKAPKRKKEKTRQQRQIEQLFAAFAKGKPFELDGYRYEVTPSGERRFFSGDQLMLTEHRSVTWDRTKSYTRSLHLQPILRDYPFGSAELQLAAAILATGKLSLMAMDPEDEDDKHIVSSRIELWWPDRHEAVFSRSSITAQFRCQFRPCP